MPSSDHFPSRDYRSRCEIRPVLTRVALISIDLAFSPRRNTSATSAPNANERRTGPLSGRGENSLRQQELDLQRERVEMERRDRQQQELRAL